MSDDRDGRRKPATSDPSYPYLQQPAIPAYGEALRPGVSDAGLRLVSRQCIRPSSPLHPGLEMDQGDPQQVILPGMLILPPDGNW